LNIISMNLDFLSLTGLEVTVSVAFAPVSFSQLLKKPGLPSTAEGVLAVFSNGFANGVGGIEGSTVAAGSALGSSLSTTGVSFARICSFQRWNSS
jgi:hypothetical protein